MPSSNEVQDEILAVMRDLLPHTPTQTSFSNGSEA
jgi:hypothetical protein